MKSRRTMSNLPDTVHQQLNLYAQAAEATGDAGACGLHVGQCHHSPTPWPYLFTTLGLLALAAPSEARIVYTPTNVDIQSGRFSFDLNHDGISDLVLEQSCRIGYGFARCALDAKPAQGNAILVQAAIWPAALKRGANIGNAMPFATYPAGMAIETGLGLRIGYWFHTQARFLGVKFQIKGKIHFGWMRLTNSSGQGATLTGYAYETIAGKAIKAGAKGTDDDVANDRDNVNRKDPGPGAFLTSPIPDAPPPASLGMLALGARSVQLWRRKEEAEVAQ